MESAVTLGQLKAQVNVEDADTTYDAQLIELGQEATEYVVELTGRSHDWFMERYGRLPLPLRRAVLLVAGDWFAYREGGRPSGVCAPETTIAPIINRYRRLI